MTMIALTLAEITPGKVKKKTTFRNSHSKIIYGESTGSRKWSKNPFLNVANVKKFLFLCDYDRTEIDVRIQAILTSN